MTQNPINDNDDVVDDKTELTNSASRLHSIIEPALALSVGTPAVQVWASIFGVDPDSTNQDPHDVVDRLRLMRDEVSILRRVMRETKFSTDLYEPALNAVSLLISVSNLSSQWGNFRPHMLPEHMLALRWCAQAVLSEVGLTHAELQRLLDAIADFRASVEEDDLPESVKGFVLHQADLMIRGIHEYPIRGRQAVRDSVKEAAIDMLDASDEFNAAAPIKLREKLAALWKAGLGAAEGSEKMIKLITGIAEAVPKLSNALHAAANSLQT